MVNFVTRAVASRESSSPKTVLGFFVLVLTVMGAVTVPLIAVLASQEDLRYLIPIVLTVVAVIFLVVLGAILWIVIFGDPTRLMLGQVTGSEYREFQKMVIGDSESGVTLLLARGATPQVTAETTPPPEIEQR